MRRLTPKAALDNRMMPTCQAVRPALDLVSVMLAVRGGSTARLDGHEAAIVAVLQRLMRLLDPPPAPEPPRGQIGFHVQPESGTENKLKAKKK